MTQASWESCLQELNQLQLTRVNASKYGQFRYSPEVLESRWLGQPGATKEQIAEVEARLGVTLPNSYKEFLKASNGWGDWKSNVPDFNLLPIEEIDWFPAKNPEWSEDQYVDYDEVPDELYFVYGSQQDSIHIRYSFLKKALQISNLAETMVLILNPQVIVVDSEWEAWCMDSKLPGANRYKTFWDLMQVEPGY